MSSVGGIPPLRNDPAFRGFAEPGALGQGFSAIRHVGGLAGLPPERASERAKNVSFRPTRDTPRVDGEFESMRRQLTTLGFDDDDVDEIVSKRPNDALTILRTLGDLSTTLARLYTPSQLIMVATSSGTEGLQAMSTHSDVLTHFGHTADQLVRVAQSVGAEGLRLLRDVRHVVTGFDPLQLAEIVVVGGPDALDALRKNWADLYPNRNRSELHIMACQPNGAARLQDAASARRDHNYWLSAPD